VLVGWGKEHPAGISFEDVTIKSLPQFISEITAQLSQCDPAKEAVPEHWPLLRAIQMAVFWGSRDTIPLSNE
jgi:hypothetical protein